MALYVIDLNDAGVRLANAEGSLKESPGYALLQQDRLLLGAAARSEARLHPRHIHHQFWARLSNDGLPQPTPRARTVADLAYAHLLDLCADLQDGDAEVVFAVPGQFDRQQLALLLGIARECPFRAVGLVDRAVAAVAAAGSTHQQALYVDGQLHRSVITRLQAGAELQRDRVDDTPATSLLGLQDAMVGLIADAFIRETRFDPLHEAVTEQRLYDHLGGWLGQLAAAGEAILELDTGRSSYRVSLHQDRLVEKLRPRYRQLAERLGVLAGEAAEIHLSATLATMPGLIATLGEALPGNEVIVAEAEAASRGAFAHIDQIRRDGDRLAFITRLPNAAPSPPAASSPQPAPSPPEPATPEPDPEPEPLSATHILIGHEAWPLAAGPLLIGASEPGAGIVLATATTPQCTVRRQGHGIRLDPEYGADIRRDGQPLETATQLALGETVWLSGDLPLTPISVREPA